MAGIEKPNRYRGQTWQVCPDDIPVRFESLLGSKFKLVTECGALELISVHCEAAAAAPEIWRAPSRGLPLSKFIVRHQVAGAAPAGRRPTLEIGEQYIYSGRHARSFRAWRFAPGRISAKVTGTTFFYF